MDPLRRTTRLTLLSLLMSSLLAGCGSVSPLEPTLTAPPEPAPVVSNEPDIAPPSVLHAPGADPALLDFLAKPLNLVWQVICEKVVQAGRLEVVKAQRYELTFQRTSLDATITCTIKQYDPNILDVELGPHGTKFEDPVTFTIDFRDTEADPHSATANGCEPVVWWWNDQRHRWEEVPGTTDWQARKHSVRLAHFSRYVVGGKAGWKGQPLSESD